MRRLRRPDQFGREVLGVERVVEVSVVVDQLGLEGARRKQVSFQLVRQMREGLVLTGKPSMTLARPLMTIMRFVLSSFSHVAIALAISVASTSLDLCGSVMAMLLTITARQTDEAGGAQNQLSSGARFNRRAKQGTHAARSWCTSGSSAQAPSAAHAGRHCSRLPSCTWKPGQTRIRACQSLREGRRK